jgi:hypothetical protein
MSKILEPQILGINTTNFFTKDLNGKVVKNADGTVREIISPDVNSNNFVPKTIPFAGQNYIFIQDYKENKKGDVVAVAYDSTKIDKKIKEAIDARVLVTEREKSFMDANPIRIKSLVNINTDAYNSGRYYIKAPVVVEKNKEYRGVLLGDGRFQLSIFDVGSQILKKGEYELLDRKYSNLVTIALLALVGLVAYKLIRK